jgi:hypothetical protein
VLTIPRAPGALELPIENVWDGRPGPGAALRGLARLQVCADGIAFEASLWHDAPARVPDAPQGTRVANLWEYDVVECFLVGADGRYLELELGAGGHFLALLFDAPRKRCDELADWRPQLEHAASLSRWTARMLAPWRIVPTPIRALNAFAAAGGALLAHHPLPGPQADFHQPARFPAACADGDEGEAIR